VQNHRSAFRSAQDGILLHHTQWGEGPPDCFLIHGLGEGSFVWSDFAPQLAAFCRVAAIDLRGHGGSDWDPDSRYSIEAHASDVEATVAAIGAGRIVLVGHSIGGNVALRVASKLGGRVCALVLVDFGPGAPAAAITHVRSAITGSHKAFAGPEEFAGLLAQTRPLAGKPELAQYAKSALRRHHDGFYRQRWDPAMVANMPADGQASDGEIWDKLRSVRCPTLVMRGMGSALLSMETAQAMAKTLQHGKLVTVGAAGHGVMTDNPNGFASAALPFVKAALMPEEPVKPSVQGVA
jgi:pimeloyl-ACP methyl ester carboxylesterase